MAAVAAVAVVALDRDHGLGHHEQLLRHEESAAVSEARVRRRITVGHPEPAANAQVESGQPALLLDGSEAEIVAVDVHVVQGRHGDRHLELARR